MNEKESKPTIPVSANQPPVQAVKTIQTTQNTQAPLPPMFAMPPPPPPGFNAPPAFPPPPPQNLNPPPYAPPPVNNMSHPRPEVELPDAKRIRNDGPSSITELRKPNESGLLSETDFASSLNTSIVKLEIKIPSDNNYMQWNCKGQILSINVDVMDKIKTVKEKIQPDLGGMPPNKMQLKSISDGVFLKDNNTLAALNIGPYAALELVPKVRGGRR